jgi:pimeloyl-ACP methyl ester carboxylesterase
MQRNVSRTGKCEPNRLGRPIRAVALGVLTSLLLVLTAVPTQADQAGNPQQQGKDSGNDQNSGNAQDKGNAQDTGNDQDSGNDDRDDQKSDRKSRNITCVADPSTTYTVKPTSLPFDALPNSTTTRSWGVLRGAGYRIEVPQNWNGELVLWAHGFRGWGCDLTIDNPPMRQYLVDNGFAWAASSYASNGYVVQQGVDDMMRLSKFFKKEIRKPKRTYFTGASMGGHVTGVAIEQHRNAFDGAMPVCGVMGSERLFDYFVDFNELALSISGVTTTYPYGADYFPVIVPQIKAALGPPTSPKFQTLGAAVMNDTGGARPGFAVALGVWQDFLYGLGQPTAGVPAFPATNVGTIYQLDSDPAVSPAEASLNASVRRVTRFDSPTPDGRVSIPRIEGNFRIPVLTMHTLGDLFVPFSIEQIYAKRAAANDKSDRLVQRAIRDVGHCSFSEAEFNQGFADLVGWVRSGTKPAGDDVLSPAAVAQPTYGCRFSNNTGAFLGTAARPAFGTC